VVAAAPPPPAVPKRDLARVFTMEDTDVVAPVTVRQVMPRFPDVLTAAVSGVIDLVIDPSGNVESARIIDPVHVRYDSLLLNAAKKWQYQPATLDGSAVRYNKRIQISLNPNAVPTSPSARR